MSIDEKINSRKLGVNNKHKNSDCIYDIIIIGGCITGVTTALMLQKAGLKTILLENNYIGFLTSGSYTTHLNTYFDALNNDIIQNPDFENLSLYAQGGIEALDCIKSNVKDYHIDCDLNETSSFIFTTEKGQEKMLDTIADVSNSQPVKIAADYILKSPLALPFTKVIKIEEEQYTINAVKYITSLLKEYKNTGGIVLEKCRVLKVDNNKLNTVYSSRGKIKGANILYTPQTPRILNLKPYAFTPYVHYTVTARLANGVHPLVTCYDMENPCHRYISYREGDADCLAVRGEDHRVVKGKKREDYFKKLQTSIKTYFKYDEFLTQWSYVYYKSKRGLPIIERTADKNVFISAGYNPDGMILATLGSVIINDLIIKGSNKYEALFTSSLGVKIEDVFSRSQDIYSEKSTA